jgi:predicted metal-dependent hydrolase
MPTPIPDPRPVDEDVSDASADSAVEVRRSTRRRRTVSAYREGERIIVLLPARFTKAQEREWVAKMVESVQTRERKALVRGPRRDDAMLRSRATALSRAHLEGRATPSSIRWVPTMRTRWASCTPADRTIRVSERLRDVPDWVLDYVIVHELAHLLVAGHGAQFWAWVQRYPRTERARGYLEGLSAAAGLGIDLGEDDED